MRRRNAELSLVPGFRHQPAVRHLDGWTVDPDWGRWHVVVLMDPRAHHAVSLFMDVATGALDFWYIDIIGPAQRGQAGFDFQGNGLDIVVQPDFSDRDREARACLFLLGRRDLPGLEGRPDLRLAGVRQRGDEPVAALTRCRGCDPREALGPS